MAMKITGNFVSDYVGAVSDLRPNSPRIKGLRKKASSLPTSLTPEGQRPFLQRENSKLQHVAIIMDGNGRWAKARGLPRFSGHREGVAAARRAIEAAKEMGLRYLTLYSFSTENWRRPQSEVRHLMDLMKRFIESDLARLTEENVRIRIIGDKKTLPADILKLVEKAERETVNNDGYFLQIAFNYGGRDELLRAMQALAQKVESGALQANNINEQCLSRALDTGDLPDPDLVIRTSGEQRISNFLLWQAAYAEFVFLDENWPDFDSDLFLHAVQEYLGRERRFGSVSE